VSNAGSDRLAALDEIAARQEAEERAARALAAARVRLVLGRDAKSAFFATLALRLTPEPDFDIETLATDGRVLRYAPGFVTALGADELVGVLCHEVMHCALAHPGRRGDRDREQWNVACDLAVNRHRPAARPAHAGGGGVRRSGAGPVGRGVLRAPARPGRRARAGHSRRWADRRPGPVRPGH
jgi:Putative metallopeptidase domain